MQRFGMMTRVIGVALGVVIAIAAVASASAQQEPPHRFYGTGATAGDTIGVVDDMGNELASATVAEDGGWYIDVDRDAVDGVSFTLNGKSADAEVTATGDGQSAVSVTAMAMEESDDSMDDGSMEDGDSMDDGSMEDGDSMDDGSMEDGDDLDSLEGEDDSMDDGSMEDDSMDDGSMEDDSMDDGSMDEGETEYPGTGSGGLADGSGVSAGLIGLLIALSVAAVAGLGLRRVRNRA